MEVDGDMCPFIEGSCLLENHWRTLNLSNCERLTLYLYAYIYTALSGGDVMGNVY